MKKKGIKFNLVYDGESLKTHEISAKDLIVAVKAMDDLLNEANATINGKDATISVKVNANFKPGSFGIDLVVLLMEFAQNALPYSEGIDAKGILDILFGTEDKSTIQGLTDMLKFLRGDPPTKTIKNKDGDLVYKGDRCIKVKKGVLDLYTPKIRKAIEALVSLVKKDHGIESVAISKDKTSLWKVRKSEVHYFNYPEPPKEKPVKSFYKVNVTVVSPFFKEEKKWIVNDGQSEFYVIIEDEEFIRRVNDHKEVFGKGDILKVLMREEQFSSPDGQKLKSEHFIEKVFDKSPPKQEKLGE